MQGLLNSSNKSLLLLTAVTACTYLDSVQEVDVETPCNNMNSTVTMLSWYEAVDLAVTAVCICIKKHVGTTNGFDRGLDSAVIRM